MVTLKLHWLIEYWLRNIFLEKSCRKQDVLKENFPKAFKKLTLFFLSNPVHFNEQNYQKEKGPRTSDQLLFSLQNEF